MTSASAPLTFFSAHLLFIFQSHLISIFHRSDGYHAHLILDIISQAIHVSGNFFIIALLMICPDVQSIEFLSVFFNCHQLLSQVMHSPEQSNLIIPGDEFRLHLRDHPVPALDLLLALAAPVSL
jgi:hypothetical protein